MTLKNSKILFFGILTIIVLVSGTLAMGFDVVQIADATKSKGKKKLEIGSKKVCGDRLCSEPANKTNIQKQNFEVISTYNDVDEDISQGKTILKDLEPPKKSETHVEMQRLHDVISDENASDSDKKQALKKIKEIKEKTKREQMDAQKQAKIRGNIDNLTDFMLTTKTSDGHPIFSSVGTDYQNESLQIGVFDEFFDEKLIKEHEQSIRKIVGKNIDITFANEGDGYKASSCSQTGDCNPIQGGVMITFEDGGSCSMGFKASYDDKDGFVSAGHCLETRGATGNDVGNPSASGSDLLGTVHANAMDYYTWCDCLFVDSSETTSGKIYSNIDPSGTYYPADEDWVLMEGFATQGSSGQIEDTYKSVWVESPWGYWYYLQGAVDTNYSGSSGDSGGPVYETGSNDFAGIHSAHDSTTGKSLYVPYYRITNAFSGLSLGI